MEPYKFRIEPQAFRTKHKRFRTKGFEFVSGGRTFLGFAAPSKLFLPFLGFRTTPIFLERELLVRNAMNLMVIV